VSTLKFVAAGTLAAVTAIVWHPVPAAAVETSEVTVTSYDLASGARTTAVVQAQRGHLEGTASTKPTQTVAASPVVSPELRAQLSRAASTGTVRALVSVAESVRMPQFPPHESDAARNQVRAQQAAALVSQIKAEREPSYRMWRDKVAMLGGRVTTEYWLAAAFEAEIPVAAVDTLAKDPQVRNIAWADQIVELPDGDVNNDIGAARALLSSDHYRGFARSTDTIALVDSGVNPHTLFNNGSVVVQDETGANPPQIGDICDHGTKTAAALVGNGNLGETLRGITAMKLRVYQVGKMFVDPDDGLTKCGTNPPASINGITHAVENGFKVIVVEAQLKMAPTSAISAAADNAFASGAVVISAAGNFLGNAGAPGNARNAISVGAVDVKTLVLNSPQASGTPDGRIKPDILAPTNYETGSGSSFNATTVYTGTSAATAAAGGAAANYWAFLRGNFGSVAPGFVYASLIVSGNHPYPFNSTEGAGRLKLPTVGVLQSFVTSVEDGDVVDIPIDLTATTCRLSVGLWWPDETGADSNDVDLQVISPSNVVVASSIAGRSVFELARTSGSTAGGRWRVRLEGFDVSGSQTVYGTLVTCR